MYFSAAIPNSNNLDPLIPNGSNRLSTLGLSYQSGNSNMMEGEGVLDIASHIYEKVKQYAPVVKAVGKKVADVYSGEFGTKATDFISSKLSDNPYQKPGFVGEKHIFMPTPYGLTKANFAGPGTHIQQRLNRGDQGINQIDKIAKAHDIAYYHAKSKDDIRRADNAMIKAVKKVDDSSNLVKNIVIAALKAKKLGEDVGVFDVQSFTKLKSLKGSGLFSDKEIDALIKRISPSPEKFLKSEVVNKIKSAVSKKRKMRGKGRAQLRMVMPKSGKGLYVPYDGLYETKRMKGSGRSFKCIKGGARRKPGQPKPKPKPLPVYHLMKQAKKQKGKGIGAILAASLAPIIIEETVKGIKKLINKKKKK